MNDAQVTHYGWTLDGRSDLVWWFPISDIWKVRVIPFGMSMIWLMTNGQTCRVRPLMPVLDTAAWGAPRVD